jgi:hypothetical protein
MDLDGSGELGLVQVTLTHSPLYSAREPAGTETVSVPPIVIDEVAQQVRIASGALTPDGLRESETAGTQHGSSQVKDRSGVSPACS